MTAEKRALLRRDDRFRETKSTSNNDTGHQIQAHAEEEEEVLRF